MTDKPENDTGAYWVSIAEAVGLLNVSERTVRRYVAEGKVSSRKDKGRLYVNLPDHKPAEPGERPDQPDKSQALQAELDKLQAELEHTRKMLDQVSGERDFLRSLVATSLTTTPKRIESGEKRWWQFWKSE